VPCDWWEEAEDGAPGRQAVRIERTDEAWPRYVVRQVQWRIRGVKNTEGRRPVLLVWEYVATKELTAAVAVEVNRVR
jgi:hypothetical protein